MKTTKSNETEIYGEYLELTQRKSLELYDWFELFDK